MSRFLFATVAILLATQAPLSAGPVTQIYVTGKLSGGNFVVATCSVSNTGQVTGTGVLYGMNTQTGTTYSYPFVITQGVTGPGTITFTGAIAGGGPPITLMATVPAGPIAFTYVVNGNTYGYTGQGTVSTK